MMKTKWMTLALTAASATMFLSAPVVAQDTQFVPDDEITLIDDTERKGFDGMLSIGANLNFTSNSSVVGQIDGYSTLFGLSVKGGLDYLWGKHEVRNTLSIQESFARTPVIDEFIKNGDVLEFESIYNYFFLKWMGAFGRLAIDTSLLPSEAVTADPTTYLITDLEGAVETRVTERLDLADAFSPLTLNESLGIFVEPIRSDLINASFRLGLGARQTIAKGVLAEKADDATPEVDIIELDNVIQAGTEAFLGAKGKFYDKRISYEVGATALIPFLNNDDTDRSAIDLMRYGLVASASTSIFSWMSLNYEFRLMKDPQLIDATQIQQALLLTFNYNLIERSGGKAGPTADELLAAAEKRIAEAEAECADLRDAAEKARLEAEAAKVDEMEAEHKKRLEDEAKRIEAEKLKETPTETPTQTPTETPTEAPTTPPTTP